MGWVARRICSKYWEYLQKTNTTDRPSQVTTGHKEQIRSSLKFTLNGIQVGLGTKKPKSTRKGA